MENGKYSSVRPKTTTKQPTVWDRALGRDISVIREQCRMSRAQLAIQLGITSQQVAKYESGEDRIPVGRMCEIVLALDLSIDQYLDRLKVVWKELETSRKAEKNAGPSGMKVRDNPIPEYITENLVSLREVEELKKAYCRIHDSDHRKSVRNLARHLSQQSVK